MIQVHDILEKGRNYGDSGKMGVGGRREGGRIGRGERNIQGGETTLYDSVKPTLTVCDANCDRWCKLWAVGGARVSVWAHPL